MSNNENRSVLSTPIKRRQVRVDTNSEVSEVSRDLLQDFEFTERLVSDDVQLPKRQKLFNEVVLNEDDLRRNGLLDNSTDNSSCETFIYVPYVYDVHLKVQIAFLLSIPLTPYNLLKINVATDPLFTSDFIAKLDEEKRNLANEPDLLVGSALNLLKVTKMECRNESEPEKIIYVITYHIRDAKKTVEVEYNINDYHEIMKTNLWKSIYESEYNFDPKQLKRTEIYTMLGVDRRIFIFPRGSNESKNIKHEVRCLQQPKIKRTPKISIGRTDLYKIGGTSVQPEENVTWNKSIIFGTFIRTEQEDVSRKDGDFYAKKKGDVKRTFGFNALQNWSPLSRQPDGDMIKFNGKKIELRFTTEMYPQRRVINSKVKIDPKDLKGQVVAVVVNNMTPCSYNTQNGRIHVMAAYAIDIIQLPNVFQEFWNNFVDESHEINASLHEAESGATRNDNEDDYYKN